MCLGSWMEGDASPSLRSGQGHKIRSFPQEQGGFSPQEQGGFCNGNKSRYQGSAKKVGILIFK